MVSVKHDELKVQDEVSSYYEEVRYQRTYSRFYHRWWIEKMFRLLGGDGLVLDNGCGTGILSEMVQGKKIVGMDYSQGMLDRARKRLKDCIRGDSESLPFRDKSFDAVFARSLLHHLPRPEQGIAEMARVLKDGGRFVIADTHKSIVSLLPRSIAKKGKHFSSEHKDLSLSELRARLEEKFEIESLCYFGYIAYPLLGFPDLVDFFHYLPFRITIARWLIRLDGWISKIPLVNRLSWGVMIAGRKR